MTYAPVRKALGRVSDATWGTYLDQRDEYVARRGRQEDGHLVLDMTQSLPMCARHATDWLRA